MDGDVLDLRFDYDRGVFKVRYLSPEVAAEGYRETDEDLAVDRKRVLAGGMVEHSWRVVCEDLGSETLEAYDPRHAEADLPIVRRRVGG